MFLLKLLREYIFPISMLSGTIIGVGLFSLPYITLKVGFWVILLYFLFLGGVTVLLHLIFAELSLKTPDFKRFPGFAKIYLGKPGEITAYFSTILGILGSLLAYLIVGGEFLESLFVPFFGGSNLFYTFIYFAIGVFIIFFGIKAVASVQFWGLILFFITLFWMFWRGLSVIEISNLFNTPDIKNIFLPYGAILFSLWGATLIPEVEEMLGSHKKNFKKIVLISILIPIFISIFFIILILGITGEYTTESALTGLKDYLGNGVVSLLLFFGVLTTFTSFVALGLTLKNVLMFDLRIKKINAFIIAGLSPMILFLLGLKSFISVISFIGGVFLGIDGILILLMYRKSILNRLGFLQTKTKILIYSLAVFLVLGIAYQIIYFLE
jgi:amino acid permease